MALAKKFKEREMQLRDTLDRDSLMGVRLAGKAFGSFTKQFTAPYDFGFMSGMDAAALYVLTQVFPSALFSYVQSDEISVVFSAGESDRSELPFAGKIEKVLSVSASAASVGLLRALPDSTGHPIFDSRLFYLKNLQEVEEYVSWRRADAQKNSVSMAAEALFSHKELMGVSTEGRQALLTDTKFEKLPEGFFNGRLISKETKREDVSYVDKRTGVANTVTVDRSRWVDKAATDDVIAALFGR